MRFSSPVVTGEGDREAVEGVSSVTPFCCATVRYLPVNGGGKGFCDFRISNHIIINHRGHRPWGLRRSCGRIGRWAVCFLRHFFGNRADHAFAGILHAGDETAGVTRERFAKSVW